MNTPTMLTQTAWDVKIADLPDEPMQRFKHLLRFAILAPSIHNTQPWRFALHENGVDVHIDPTRWLKVVDPEHREIVISVGCALEALVLAAEFVGYSANVSAFPDPASPGFAARVTLTPGASASAMSRDLFPMLSIRSTNLGLYRSTELSVSMQVALVSAVNDTEVTLSLNQTEAHKQALENLVIRANGMRFANPEYRRELALSLNEGADDPSWLMTQLQQLEAAIVNHGRKQARSDGQRIEHCANFGVLASIGDTPTMRLRVGRAFMRLSLAAARLALSVQPMNQVIEDPYFRARVFDVMFPDHAGHLVPFHQGNGQHLPDMQLAFRIGFSDEPTLHTSRRPLEDVLM